MIQKSARSEGVLELMGKLGNVHREQNCYLQNGLHTLLGYRLQNRFSFNEEN